MSRSHKFTLPTPSAVVRGLAQVNLSGGKRKMENHCFFTLSILSYLHIHITFVHIFLISFMPTRCNVCHVAVLLNVITSRNSVWFITSRQPTYVYICSYLDNGRLAIFTAAVFNSGTIGTVSWHVSTGVSISQWKCHLRWISILAGGLEQSEVVGGESPLMTGHTVTLLLCLFYIITTILFSWCHFFLFSQFYFASSPSFLVFLFLSFYLFTY